MRKEKQLLTIGSALLLSAGLVPASAFAKGTGIRETGAGGKNAKKNAKKAG